MPVDIYDKNNTIELKEKDSEKAYPTAQDVSITFRQHGRHTRYWQLEKDCGLAANMEHPEQWCTHAFETDLSDKNGWHIVDAKQETTQFLEYRFVSTVKGTKGNNTILVDLHRGLLGPKDALLDFLRTYENEISFFNQADE